MMMMKKTAIAFLFISLIILSACGSDIADQGGVVIRGEADKPVEFIEYYMDETIVYVTETGTKYHTEDCSYLSSTKIPISLEQAILEGREPCSRCNPPIWTDPQ